MSPMLFNIAVDVLQQMVTLVNEILGIGMTRRVKEPIVALQYADDTALVASADITTLAALKLILRIFTSVSGLKINFAKSSFVSINLEDHDVECIRQLLGCKNTNFPVTYLGMPLTIKRNPKKRCTCRS